jgi:hypothetical protein
VSAAARAGAPVALIGAAVANLACVPLFVHAFTIASPLSVALLRLVGCAVVLGLHQRLRPIELAGVVLVMAASVLALESGGVTAEAVAVG